LLLSNLAFSQGVDDTLSLDWDVSWEEVEEVTTKEYSIEYITHTAGVRGDEAEDEILLHLWYRKKAKRKVVTY